MQYAPLASLRHRLDVGGPVPFNIRNPDHTLLLARGQLLRDESQLEALLDRGAIVDADEAKGPRAEVYEAPPEALPALWNRCVSRVGRTLRQPDPAAFAEALDDAAQPVLALIERDPDLAIFQLVRPDPDTEIPYGVAHSVHSAIATNLVARRLGWDAANAELVFKSALTMNMAMLELQAQLATQVTPLTLLQRETIRQHPLRTVEILQSVGVDDPLWLAAVAQHHEVPGGGGYPHGIKDVGELACLLRCADIYTAKLSPRGSRSALPANRAGREIFLQGDRTPLAAAMVKEFGIFPPGCFVALHCGELGVVIRRGPTASTPVVAALTARNGDAMLEPVRRATEVAEYAIVKVISESSLRVRVSPERLAAMAAR